MEKPNPQTTEANDNAAAADAAVTISLTDLAKGLGRSEDDLLEQIAEIFAKREAETDV